MEKDLTKSSDAKELAYAQINKLNNEQKAINEKISRVTNQASTAERTAREKEDVRLHLRLCGNSRCLIIF